MRYPVLADGDGARVVDWQVARLGSLGRTAGGEMIAREKKGLFRPCRQGLP